MEYALEVQVPLAEARMPDRITRPTGRFDRTIVG